LGSCRGGVPPLFYDRQLTFDIPSGESWQRDDAEEEEPAAQAKVISLRAGAKVYRVKETGSKDEVESI
jgi:hypothetical protein